MIETEQICFFLDIFSLCAYISLLTIHDGCRCLSDVYIMCELPALLIGHYVLGWIIHKPTIYQISRSMTSMYNVLHEKLIYSIYQVGLNIRTMEVGVNGLTNYKRLPAFVSSHLKTVMATLSNSLLEQLNKRFGHYKRCHSYLLFRKKIEISFRKLSTNSHIIHPILRNSIDN